jgi:hypothetical protein
LAYDDDADDEEYYSAVVAVNVIVTFYAIVQLIHTSFILGLGKVYPQPVVALAIITFVLDLVRVRTLSLKFPTRSSNQIFFKNTRSSLHYTALPDVAMLQLDRSQSRSGVRELNTECRNTVRKAYSRKCGSCIGAGVHVNCSKCSWNSHYSYNI